MGIRSSLGVAVVVPEAHNQLIKGEIVVVIWLVEPCQRHPWVVGAHFTWDRPYRTAKQLKLLLGRPLVNTHKAHFQFIAIKSLVLHINQPKIAHNADSVFRKVLR